MKLHFSLLLFPFLLFSFLLGKDRTNQASRVLLSPNLDGIKSEKQANISLEKSQQFKPVLDPPWISMYIPVRSCHRKLKKKYGEFSPPKYQNGFEGNIWCNWTVWAGSRKHIIIYIEGFKSDDDCDKNEDKIFFHGISSFAENMAVYACWRKDVHIFATYAKGVNVVFLMRHPRKEGFVGKYYIFKHQEIRPPPKDAIDTEMPVPQPSLEAINSILQSDKESLLFILDNANSSITANHGINKAMRLNVPLQESRKNASVVALMSFFKKTENFRVPFVSLKRSGKPSEMRRMGTEEITMDLNESTTPFSVISSDITSFELEPLEQSSGFLEVEELPSKMLISTQGSFVMDHLWMNSISTQLRPTTSYQKQPSVGISLNAAAKMLSGSDKIGLKTQSRHFQELSTTTTAHLIIEEQGFPHIVTFSKTADTLSFPALDLEPSLFHRTGAALLFAIPGPESILSDHECILSPSMTPTYPFSPAGSYQTLSVSAVFQTPTISEQKSKTFSTTPSDISLSMEELGCTREETSLQGALQLDAICPSATVLESRASENAVVATKTLLSPVFLVKGLVPSLGLQTAKDIENPLSSPCNLENSYLVTQPSSSSLSIHKTRAPCSKCWADSECLFSSVVQSSAIQPWLGGKKDNCLDSESEESGKKVLQVNIVEPLNFMSTPELHLSFEKVTLSMFHPLHDSFTELLLISMPIMNEEKEPGNMAEHDFISRTIVVPLLSCSEMQSPTLLTSLPLEVVGQGKGPTRETHMQYHAKLQQPPLEFIVTGFDVPEILLKEEDINLSAVQTSTLRLSLNQKELEFPWLLVYFPSKSCHVILKNESGTFSPPTVSRMQTNKWCNWTIWAGTDKHILVYIEGFEGRSDCEKNQDKIIFQGVSSSVESKVVYACKNQGPLIFAKQAMAVHVVFLSTFISQNHIHKHFKGRYYIFEDYETFSTDYEAPLLKSKSNFELFSKSSAMHPGPILDFIKTSRKLSNENWLPVTNKEKWRGNESASSLETVLRPAASNQMEISVLKSMKNATVHPFTLKWMPVAKSSIHDTRSGNEISSGNFKKVLDRRTNILKNDEKAFMYHPVFSSSSPRVPQKVKMKIKAMEIKDNEVTTESAYLQNITTHWMLGYMRGSGRIVSGSASFKRNRAFLQSSKEKKKIPVPSPKSIARTTQIHILPSQQSHSGIFRRVTDVKQSQPPLKLKDTLKEEEMDNEMYGVDSSNHEQYMIAMVAEKNEFQRPKLPITEMPPTSTSKTLEHLDVLHAPSLGTLKQNFMDAATTSQVVPSATLKSTKGKKAPITHSSNSETRYKKYPQRMYTKPRPPYPTSDWKLRKKPYLKVEKDSYEKNFIFRTHEDHSALKSKHHPGDLLFEITFGIEYKGRLPPIRSDLEKALIGSIKRKVQEKVQLFSNKVKEVKLKEVVRRDKTEMDKQNGPNLIFTFWLHLTSEETNMPRLVYSKLEDLSGISMGIGEIRNILVRDVNECNTGIGQCDAEATCLNGFGTYICQCKEEYEDHSLTKSGTLCLRGSQSESNRRRVCNNCPCQHNDSLSPLEMKPDSLPWQAFSAARALTPCTRTPRSLWEPLYFSSLPW
ncbi:uncharacterized protein LOC103279406 isoform X2 [Anolis carolinensis]|uniref:uncharacterized protein LOC103279406 isoform X2 n=1 Tax=Anolis carolinensis TaxID=28377 RepID=UPI0004629094|nr:PREDICTED: uncharacterized protein LOC103279406 isoform X2 [Anolis carolinensis]|eukprot:XP_008112551.1 PREDICTED: uncharacterized protein LOC103279406 isoform X2 [Anolis carolinensis]